MTGAPLHVGDFSDHSVLLAVCGFILTGFLMIRKVTGAIILGIISVTIVALLAGMVKMPEARIDSKANQ